MNGRGTINGGRARWAAGVALALLAAAVLLGCARQVETKRFGFPSANGHVSPPPVAVPRLPPGTFDRARGQAQLAAAIEARQRGDTRVARAAAAAAVTLWPGEVAAWSELATDCGAAGDASCARYAAFFHDKVEFVAALPPRVGVLGFATLASAKEGTHSGNYVYDRQTLDTALRLASFYDEQDTLRGTRLYPSHPLSPAKSKPAPNP